MGLLGNLLPKILGGVTTKGADKGTLYRPAADV